MPLLLFDGAFEIAKGKKIAAELKKFAERW
jgi:hypothetical protein